MKAPHRILILLVFALAVFLPSPAAADGIIVPDPSVCIDCPPPPIPITQLNIRYHRVEVVIEDQLAVTRVDQVFHNPNDWQVEGTYIFPIPPGAAVTSFTLWVDGEPVKGEILDAEQARQTYEEIVRSLQDPALLEYAGQGAVQARIFPIPPDGERRIQLEYTQALTADQGLVRYQYPLNTEKFSVEPLEEVSISVQVKTSQPVRAVYSPSHPIDVSRSGENRFSAGYEDRNVRPDSDFVLYYSVGTSEALHLLTYRDAGDPQDQDGFFMLLLAPRQNILHRVIPKDVILVLDRSGSMEGEKFSQAQEALRYMLDNLNEEDRFNIVTFSTAVETYAARLRPASEANDALRWVDRLSPVGSTDINRALLEAASLADRERPTYLIFLTDGLPTQGVTDSQAILDNFAGSASRNLRLFAFGVGYDVDTFLLDSLAQAHSGLSTYVQPGERLDEILSAFYAKISTPVLTDLELDFGEMDVYDLYPSPLPDLFLGSQIVVVGRYRQGGEATITLRGSADGETQTFRYPEQAFAQDNAGESEVLSSLPRLWATRKIGYLLNQVRLQGADQEMIDQIVRLSIRYGIVTPYTSYLVTEPMPLGAAEQERIAQDQFNQMQGAPAAPSFGQAAVEKAAGEADLAQAEGGAALPEEAADQVRIVGPYTFVSDGERWLDTRYDPDMMRAIPVQFLSQSYFELLGAYPELGPALALGHRLVVLADGRAYEIVSAETQVEPLELSTPTAPEIQVQPTETPLPDNILVDPPQNPPRQAPIEICGLPFLPVGLVLGLFYLKLVTARIEEER